MSFQCPNKTIQRHCDAVAQNANAKLLVIKSLLDTTYLLTEEDLKVFQDAKEYVTGQKLLTAEEIQAGLEYCSRRNARLKSDEEYNNPKGFTYLRCLVKLGMCFLDCKQILSALNATKKE